MSIILNLFFASGIMQVCLLLLTSTSVKGYSIGTVEKLTKCSKYDFEEKLLERLVRLEHSIELERKLKQFEDMLSEKVIKLETENGEKLKKIEHANSEKLKKMEQTNSEKLKQMEQTNSEKMEEMKISMNEMLKRLDEEDIRRNNSFQSQREEYVKERSRQKIVLNEEMHNFTVNSQDILNKITENNNNLFNISMTACAQHTSYSGRESVLFPHINAGNGISSKVISSLKDTGIFKCEKSGLYLISIFMSTNEHSRYIYLNKNIRTIAYLYFSLNGYSQTSSATVLENLRIGDTLEVKPSGTMLIYGNLQSCMSILQLTN